MRDWLPAIWLLLASMGAVAVLGGAVVLVWQWAASASAFYLLGGLAALAGVAYWSWRDCRGAEWDRELVGLIALVVFLADIMIFRYALCVAMNSP